MIYSLIKPLLFSLDPEVAHDLVLNQLAMASKTPLLCKPLERMFGARVPDLPVRCMGLEFRHPVGLAAGLDKHARALTGFSALGFSGVEMGTVTPQPQSGNDKPRLFRLLEDEAFINRMGFNSVGVEAFLSNLQSLKRTAVAGINIGKNATTDNDHAHRDYMSAMRRVYAQADYITVNISSPNTQSLRDLQNAALLDKLLLQIKNTQAKCQKVHNKKVPIALKVAPDLDAQEIETIAELLISHQFDALIATNTTVARPASLQSRYADQSGGLSGAPVKAMANECIRQFYQHLNGRVQIIGVGGIQNAEDAWDKMLAGADFLQVYSQFIYAGPALIENIVKGLQAKVQDAGFADLPSALNALRQ